MAIERLWARLVDPGEGAGSREKELVEVFKNGHGEHVQMLLGGKGRG